MVFVNIFLASSITELHDDRLALGDYVRKLNDIYMERGVYFRLFLCEDESAVMADLRKQEEYNQKIRDSQLFFILFFNNAGQYTLEEFDVAYQQFKRCGSPAIVTCFRQGAGYAPQPGVLDFMRRLDQELGHYFKVYEHIDSLKLSLLMQVKLMNLDVPVEFKEGAALVDGQQVLTLENLPMLAKNLDFQRLRQEAAQCESEFQAAKARYLQDPQDDAAFLASSERRAKARKALQELEASLMRLLLNAEEKGARDQLTPRQREAYALLEQGRSREASAMLDTDEILADAATEAALAQPIRERLEQRVQELLQKIEIEKTLTDDPKRFDRIREIYEKAMALEEKERLSKKAMHALCGWLLDQNDSGQAIFRIERYKKYMELEGSEAETADAANLLGMAYKQVGRFQDAEAQYRQARELFERLAQADPDAHLHNLAMVCNNLGNLYGDLNRDQEAEDAFLRAIEIRERLARQRPREILPMLANVCGNLGVLYRDTDRYQEAEAQYLRAKEIYEQRCGGAEAILPDLARVCNNLAVLYRLTGRKQLAEETSLRAQEIYERLAQENPGAYLPDLALLCVNLGVLYKDTGRDAQAEAAYLRAKEIRETLARQNPDAALPGLALVCYNLGILYSKNGWLQEAETVYKRSLEIREALAKANPDAYLPALASTCNSMAVMYMRAGRHQEAEGSYLRALEIQQRLAQGNANARLLDLADTHHNLGVLYGTTERYDQAEAAYLKAREIYERLAQANPRVYLPDVARTCTNLGLMYRETGREREAEEQLQRAREIKEKLG